MIYKYAIDTSSITSFLSEAATAIKTIGFSIAVIAVIALAILIIGGGNQGMQKGKGMAISILVGVVVLALGTSIITSVYESMNAIAVIPVLKDL